MNERAELLLCGILAVLIAIACMMACAAPVAWQVRNDLAAIRGRAR